MADVTIIGIDPGRIHTGCVALLINPVSRTIGIGYDVINGVDVGKVKDWIGDWTNEQIPCSIFIEDYNPGNYAHEDKKMSEALGRLKGEFPPSDDPIVRYVDNAGVNTLVPRPVLEMYGVDKFPVTTHHNDLVSAAKIALLGMLRDKTEGLALRNLVSQVVAQQLVGIDWRVTQYA